MPRRHAIFNASDCGAGLEVAGDRLTLTTTGNGLSTSRLCRGTVAQSAYLSDVEFLPWGDDGAIANVVVGVASVDASLATVLGGDAYGVGYYPATGEVKSNGAVLTTLDTAALRDVLTIILDATDAAAPTMTVQVNGNPIGTVAIPAGLIGEPLFWAASLGSTTAGDLQLQALSGQRDSQFPVAGSSGWWSAGAAVPTARLCTRDYISAPTDSPPNERHEGIIAVESIRRGFGVEFWTDGADSSVVPSTAEIIVHDAQGRLDAWVENGVRNVPAELIEIDRDGALADGDRLGLFVVEDIIVLDDGRKRILLRSGIPELEEPLQRRLIRPDAAQEVANTPEPVLYGAGLSIEPVLVDGVACMYMIADKPLGKLGIVRDAGDPFDPATDFTVQVSGREIELVSPPGGTVTLDASSVGEGITGSGEILTSTGMGRWDSSQNAAIVGDNLKLTDNTASSSHPIEAYVVKAGAIAAGKSYRLTLNWTGRSGFFGGTGQRAELAVGFSTTDTVKTWKVYTETGFKTLTINNVTGATQDLILQMRGTGATTDYIEIDDASFSLVEIVEVVAGDELDPPLDPLPFAELVTEVLATRKGLSSSRYSLTDAQALDTDSGYAGIGYYTKERVPAKDPIEMALVGYTGCMWEDADGVLRFGRLTAPEDVAEVDRDFEIDMDVLNLSDLKIDTDHARGLTLSMATTRNWRVMPASELATDIIDVTFEYRRAVSKKHRHTVHTAAAVAENYRLSELADPVETILHRRADGQAEINRVVPFYENLRRFYTVEVPLGAYRPLQVGTLRCSRYSWLADGMAVHIRHVTEDRAKRVSILRLWGH